MPAINAQPAVESPSTAPSTPQKSQRHASHITYPCTPESDSTTSFSTTTSPSSTTTTTNNNTPNTPTKSSSISLLTPPLTPEKTKTKTTTTTTIIRSTSHPQFSWTNSQCRELLYQILTTYFRLEEVSAKEIALQFEGDGGSMYRMPYPAWKELTKMRNGGEVWDIIHRCPGEKIKGFKGRVQAPAMGNGPRVWFDDSVLEGSGEIEAEPK